MRIGRSVEDGVSGRAGRPLSRILPAAAPRVATVRQPSAALQLAVVLSFAAALLLVSSPAAALTNGDFSAGLDGWSTSGPVRVSAGALLLEDEDGDIPLSSSAWQVVAAEAPAAVLSFDVLPSLSPFTPSDPFGFPDIFATSIYLFDEPNGFDPANATALATSPVLSIDADGPYDVFAMVEPSMRGGDWLHVSLTFDTPYAYFAPAFELFELALEPGDSAVRIDDVVIAPIPEPSTAVLMGLGLIGLVNAGRRSDGGRKA